MCYFFPSNSMPSNVCSDIKFSYKMLILAAPFLVLTNVILILRWEKNHEWSVIWQVWWNGDITCFICHVTWCVHVINGLCNFVGNTFSSEAKSCGSRDMIEIGRKVDIWLSYYKVWQLNFVGLGKQNKIIVLGLFTFENLSICSNSYKNILKILHS